MSHKYWERNKQWWLEWFAEKVIIKPRFNSKDKT